MKLSSLIPVLSLLTPVILLLIINVSHNSTDAKYKKPSMFIIFNLMVAIIFLLSRSVSPIERSFSAEHDDERMVLPIGEEEYYIQGVGIELVTVSEGNDENENKDVDGDDNPYAGDDEYEISDGDHEYDSDEGGMDADKLKRKADEFIAKMFGGWAEERLRERLLMQPP